MTSHEWQPTVFLNGDIAEKIAKISNRKGRICTFMEAQNLVQTLLRHDVMKWCWPLA